MLETGLILDFAVEFLTDWTAVQVRHTNECRQMVRPAPRG
jgi:hypothetical protein